jgi:hypothetical protein
MYPMFAGHRDAIKNKKHYSRYRRVYKAAVLVVPPANFVAKI